MSNTIKRSIALFMILLAALILVLPAVAAQAGFSVNAILPDNQKEGTSGYFNLTMQPGQVQQLEVAVHNMSSEDIVVKVEAITASTNRNGIINYTSNQPVDETMRHGFAQLAALEQERYTIPANSMTLVPFTVTMPDETLDGEILGAIQVLKELSEEEKRTGGMILNQYSYVVAVRMSMTDAEIQPDFDLGEVTPELNNARASIVSHIRNPQPILVRDLYASVQILPAGSAEPILEGVMEAAEMAPNSILPFTLSDEEGYGLKAGTYLSRVHLEHQGQTWDFEREFVIEAAEAAAVNEGAVNQNQPTAGRQSAVPGWAIALIILGVLLLLAVVALLVIVLKRTGNKAARACGQSNCTTAALGADQIQTTGTCGKEVPHEQKCCAQSHILGGCADPDPWLFLPPADAGCGHGIRGIH